MNKQLIPVNFSKKTRKATTNNATASAAQTKKCEVKVPFQDKNHSEK
jgi:hypothetical protein